jgi:DNA-binding PadR family transcriptional regulator
MAEQEIKVTDAELALLSLLFEQPMHGYQIEQTIEARGMREWTQIGFSSIYYVLEKMKNKGWLTSVLQQESGPGPARKVFQLTDAGRQIWKAAVMDALSDPHRAFSNFSLGLANLLFLKKDEILTAVTAYRQQLQERRDNVDKKLASYGTSLPWEVVKLFDYSLAQIDCEIRWVEEFIAELNKR